MYCDFSFKNIKKFIINLCNGSLYSFDYENEYEYEYENSYYEMKKKDLTDEQREQQEQNIKHCSINIREKEQNDEIYKFVAMAYIKEHNKNIIEIENKKEKEDWEILL